MTSREPLVALACVALVVSACDRAATPAAEQKAVTEPQEVLVTRDSGAGPTACRPSAAGDLMTGFLHAVNAGSNPTRFFASSFQWYSMTEGNPRAEGRHFAAFDLPKLATYFDTRATHDESMRLLELSVQYDRGRDLGHIQYMIERTADDTADFGTIATGKGAIACAEGKLELLSMGMAKGISADMGPLCPEPRRAVPDAAVVCTT